MECSSSRKPCYDNNGYMINTSTFRSQSSVKEYTSSPATGESYLADAAERVGDLWLQELKMIRPLVDTDNILNPDSTIRSESTDSPHMVIYTNPSKLRLAVFSQSPDQQRHEKPAIAWQRIFRPTEAPELTHTSEAIQQTSSVETSPQARKHGRLKAIKQQCGKAKRSEELNTTTDHGGGGHKGD